MRSFTKSLYLASLFLIILLALSFTIYQHQREKAYKIDVLEAKMQVYNLQMEAILGDKLSDPEAFNNYVANNMIAPNLRVTLINSNGYVLLDSYNEDVSFMENHLDREEVQKALENKEAYSLKRASSLSGNFFYSASYFPERQLIIRSAIPYNSQLVNSLKSNNNYILFIIFITALLCFALYKYINRIGKHIEHLKNFAIKAQDGKELSPEDTAIIPNDELGEISKNIISLYFKLKHSEEDKLRLKRQLTQNAAHELKTPASNVKAYLETLTSNPQMDEEQKAYALERAYAQSKRMCNLLNDMSTLTRLDEGASFDLSKEFDLAELIYFLKEDYKSEAQDKGITISIGVPADLKYKGNANLIEGIFRNIIENSIAYSKGNSISIICFEDKEKYSFSISDNGNGVGPNDLAHLFERFYRVDKGRSREMGGTGLGLAIVKNSVTLHGGTVNAISTPGGGLTIKFSLRK